jgi:site-specific recombinase XerD
VKRLEQALNDYLCIRRGLGFQLQEEESRLRNFVAFVQAERASCITRQLVLRWATRPAKAQPFTWAQRFGIIRRFAIWYSVIEPRTEIPPAGLLPHRYRRKPPYIYSDEEIQKLLRRTQQLSSPKGLRAHTYTTLFGLLVATGMRVNEALTLDRPECG